MASCKFIAVGRNRCVLCVLYALALIRSSVVSAYYLTAHPGILESCNLSGAGVRDRAVARGGRPTSVAPGCRQLQPEKLRDETLNSIATCHSGSRRRN